MAKKKYYDKYGNQIRSKPKKRLYQKGPVWLMAVSFLAVIVIIATTYAGKKDIADEPAASKIAEIEGEEDETVDKVVETTEKAVDEQIYTYEDFKGTYAMFEGEPYESPISHAITIDDDSVMSHNAISNDGAFEITHSATSVAILEQTIEGTVLTLDWTWDADYYGTLELAISYQGNQKNIRNISTEDTFLPDNTHTLYPMSEQDLLEQYGQVEIDYARIIMMTDVPRIDPVKPSVYVKKHSAGDPVFRVDGSASYPENITVL